jgi:hypothetical protein
MRKTWGIAGAPAGPYEPIGPRASFNMNGDSLYMRALFGHERNA